LSKKLKQIEGVCINSNNQCIPHILNISVTGIKAETFIHSLEKHNIFISTKSACSDINSVSESVLSLTNDIDKAKSSLRISISHLTNKKEIDLFLNKFKDCYNQLTNISKRS
jgi:cysteine desulfurase